jgi:hypothetical protein
MNDKEYIQLMRDEHDRLINKIVDLKAENARLREANGGQLDETEERLHRLIAMILGGADYIVLQDYARRDLLFLHRQTKAV